MAVLKATSIDNKGNNKILRLITQKSMHNRSLKKLKVKFYMQTTNLNKKAIDSDVRKTPLAFEVVFIAWKFFVDPTLGA